MVSRSQHRVCVKLTLESIVVLAAASSCTPTPYAPPARFAQTDTAVMPAQGKTDVQGDLGVTAALFGPAFQHADGRVRFGATSRMVIETEGGAMQLDRSSDTQRRDGYAGRVGVVQHGRDRPGGMRRSVFGGVGGGFAPAAGTWASIDGGGGIAGSHRWARPFLSGDLAYNRPLARRTFSVADDGNETSTDYRVVLHQDITLRGTFGLELGPSTSCLVLGASITRLIPLEDPGLETNESIPGFVTLTAGFRAQL